MNYLKTLIVAIALTLPSVAAFATDYDPVAGVTGIHTNAKTPFRDRCTLRGRRCRVRDPDRVREVPEKALIPHGPALIPENNLTRPGGPKNLPGFFVG
jgi:hypothetical protein